MANREVIGLAPLQVYSSALVFVPRNSVVKKMFIESIPHWIHHIPNTKLDWTSQIQTLEGHSSPVHAVAFSPDGKQVASGARTVGLWDLTTGELQQTFFGHSNLIYTVAFSPDGSWVASGS